MYVGAGGGVGEACREVFVELAPVLGKVERAPATWDLGEVGGVWLGETCCGERVASVEKATTGGVQLERFLLVETDTEEARRACRCPSIAVVEDKWNEKA